MLVDLKLGETAGTEIGFVQRNRRRMSFDDQVPSLSSATNTHEQNSSDLTIEIFAS